MFPSSEVWSEMKGKKYREKNRGSSSWGGRVWEAVRGDDVTGR